ncbi:MAG: L,D-transpeptidase family protein [Gammaproteobacteria bacterium]|nr:L,D-transpeptidase family protein [Gammaproteobacteria bacterium]
MLRTLTYLAISLPLAVNATTHPMPPSDVGLVGETLFISANHEDTLLDIARQYSIGQKEIVDANRDVDRWLPGEGTEVIIPSRHILPDAERSGIVVNLPEMRLYFFDRKEKTVRTHPVSVGRLDWNTPLGVTKITEKRVDPTWTPPESIKKEHLEAGDPLPDVVPAGPDNPLGTRAMRLGIPGYLIHGTNRPWGVGERVTHGCIRMYPEDVERLFDEVGVGEQVTLVNQPIKASLAGGMLYVESHPALDEDAGTLSEMIERARVVIEERTGLTPADYSFEAMAATIAMSTGIPTYIPMNAESAVSDTEQLLLQ